MLTKRLIACFDVVDDLTQIEASHEIAALKENVAGFAEEMYDAQIDELYIFDKTARNENRHINLDIVRKVAEHVFVPLTAGGGISGLDDMYKALKAGAEKIGVNTIAVKNPKLIEEGAKAFGAQCVLLTVHAKKDNNMPSGYEVYVENGSIPTGLDAIEWIKKAEQLGAGELCLRTIEVVGSRGYGTVFAGFDSTLIKKVEKYISMPIIASCTAATPEQIKSLFNDTEAGAVILGNALHPIKKDKDYSVVDLKKYLIRGGINVRPPRL